jgi:hypothetical protein
MIAHAYAVHPVTCAAQQQYRPCGCYRAETQGILVYQHPNGTFHVLSDQHGVGPLLQAGAVELHHVAIVVQAPQNADLLPHIDQTASQVPGMHTTGSIIMKSPILKMYRLLMWAGAVSAI